VRDADPDFSAEIRRAIDAKTKPPGSLGRIEALAARIAEIQGTLAPRMERCALTIFAADHGLAEEGVSAFPQAVTRQMVLNFLAGGAAANVFARSVGASLRVVDAGVREPIDAPGLVIRRMGPGTANSAREPAMSEATLDEALAAGRRMGEAEEADAAAFGEMGIANTAAASLVIHKIAGLPLETLVGRGTGLDDAGLAAKREILTRAAARTGDLSPRRALAEYGGFEMVMMTGAMLGAAASGKAVIVDGFIATAAALAAQALEPGAARAFVFAHRSAEAGHAAALEHLGAAPLLSLDMRLGEGTGALLAWPLLQAAAAMLRDMASFESAGVSNRG
jgi:nicotinate-nucleotide--dimethylbenzimidazole phosphoribosyltransferase